MEYYNLNYDQKNEIDNIVKNDVHLLANELGNKLFMEAFENGSIDNYEPHPDYEDYPEVYQWWIVSEWLAEKLVEDNEVVMESNGVYFWGRCGCGYALECDFVSIYKKLNTPFNTTK